MALVRFNPYREMEQVLDRMNKLFSTNGAFFDTGSRKEESLTLPDWSPACDIQENAEAYLVNAELPDVKKEDVKVTVQEGILSLSGERKQEKEEKGKKFHRIERSFGRFERSFSLPGSIDETKIAASFKDGMLHVTVPKAAAAKTNGHEIKIS